MNAARWVVVIGMIGVTAASGCATAPSRAARIDAARAAVTALRDGRFAESGELARTVLSKDSGNSDARAVQALARYKAAGEQLIMNTASFAEGIFRGNANHVAWKSAVTDFEAALGRIDEDLRIAATDREFAMELCPACWKVDWNHNGRVDSFDERLFQNEIDENGQRMDANDPRRTPTFRFDVGDLHWARAMIAFQRGLTDVILAYQTNLLSMKLFDSTTLGLELIHKERITAARAQFLIALDESDATRNAYLAETDDDREWLPNPKQKSHPMPLPVDDQLYATWSDIIGDLRRLVRGDEGLELRGLANLIDDRTAKVDLPGYLDVGKWFSEPRNISIDLKQMDDLDRQQKHAELARSTFGYAIAPTMKPSPIFKHLLRIKSEVAHGQESIDRKLRYLFWVN